MVFGIKVNRVEDNNSKVSKANPNKKQKTGDNQKEPETNTTGSPGMEEEAGDAEIRQAGAPGPDVNGHIGRFVGTTASNISAEISARELETYETYRHHRTGVWWYMNTDVVDDCHPTGVFSQYRIVQGGVQDDSGVLKSVLDGAAAANRQDLASYYQVGKNNNLFVVCEERSALLNF